jgi:hypothetical protein
LGIPFCQGAILAAGQTDVCVGSKAEFPYCRAGTLLYGRNQTYRVGPFAETAVDHSAAGLIEPIRLNSAQFPF